MALIKSSPVIAALVLLLTSNTLSSNDEAWKALANLHVVEAKMEFSEARLKQPEDLSLMRGLFIAAALDLDHDTQVQMVDSMIHYHPGNPYLLAIFEHVAFELTGWSDQLSLKQKIGESLISHSKGALAHSGRNIKSPNPFGLDSLQQEWNDVVNNAPGFWICGPFDNTSHIAVHRPLEIETTLHDTLEFIQAKDGYAARWSWLETDTKGNALLGQTTEVSVGDALVLRVFFELPSDMDLLILPGGGYAGRILIDGHIVSESVRYRNAVQREGSQVRLTSGSHSLTAVVADFQGSSAFSVGILNLEYEPIDGFQWLRHGQSSPSAPTKITAIHPIFDTWEEHLSAIGEEPDSRYWRAILLIYNGYVGEAITYLEGLQRNGQASLLELVALYAALDYNKEESRGLSVLSQIREAVSCVAVDVNYHAKTTSNYAETLQIFENLRDQYGSRIEIEMMTALRPLLKGDIAGFEAAMNSLIEHFPKVALLHQVLYQLYGGSLGDNEKALEQFRIYCDKIKSEILYRNGIAQFLISAKRYDEACQASLETIGTQSIDLTIGQAMNAHRLAGRMIELLPLLDSLIKRYPVNLEMYSSKYSILRETGQYAQADSVLREIHSIKPTAILPYQRLPELHNDIAIDSILGTVDVMDYWDTPPDSFDLDRSNIWTLFDRSQFLITEAGPVLEDYHYAHVVLNEAAVQDFQKIEIPIDVSQSSSRLITARRLRRKAPPLAAQRKGNTLIFQDLQVGDAVELRYRYWSGVSGDLWHHWWKTFQAQAGYFQRHWEYVVLTNRDDISYYTIAPFPQAIEDTHCGYHRYTWGDQNSPAVNTDLWYQPPNNEMMGQLYITTIGSWDLLAGWYGAVAKAVLRDNPRADALADSLTAGLNDDLEKVKALYAHTVLQLPYQTIGFEYHASIPHDPDQVIINSWGDCKDKSFLLTAMLNRVGLEAWPVLVRTWSNGSDLPIPQFNFDHLITACRLGSDTAYLDPAGDANPVGPWLALGIAGQPCLHINNSDSNQISYLPGLKADDFAREDTMIVQVSIQDPSSFVYHRNYARLAAGDVRGFRKGHSNAELKSQFESSIAESFGLVTVLDSIRLDSAASISEWHHESLYGTFELSLQQVGTTTILTPPVYSIVSKTDLSNLYGSGKRSYPVDLRWSTSHYRRRLVMVIPSDLGTPQSSAPVHLIDSLWEFSFSTQWNDQTRELVLEYDFRIEDGKCSPDEYEAFARKVIDVYDSPLVFTSH